MSVGQPAGADDDWTVVSHHQEPVAGAAPDATSRDSQAAHGGEILDACGEKARPAQEPFLSIMNTLDQLWSAHVRIYESVNPVGPHSRSGGCVFYNSRELSALLGGWMNVQSTGVQSMLYAIYAHELGHQLHSDFDPARTALGSVRCELEADQFAGYTLSRLNIRAENIADYYRLTGDDFAGANSSHGNSAQRAEAFMQGWRRGEMGLSEQSVIGVGGVDHP